MTYYTTNNKSTRLEEHLRPLQRCSSLDAGHSAQTIKNLLLHIGVRETVDEMLVHIDALQERGYWNVLVVLVKKDWTIGHGAESEARDAELSDETRVRRGWKDLEKREFDSRVCCGMKDFIVSFHLHVDQGEHNRRSHTCCGSERQEDSIRTRNPKGRNFSAPGGTRTSSSPRINRLFGDYAVCVPRP